MEQEQSHILVVDDDVRLRELLNQYLSEQGFFVAMAENAADARKKLSMVTFDLIVLDIMMPGESGLELAASLPNPKPPILLLTAMGEAEDRIAGLEAGAQDYLVKPFEPRELILRIQNILKRSENRPVPKLRIIFGEFVFDLSNNELTQAGEQIYLTSGEAQLLKILAEQSGEPISREKLASMTSTAGKTNERSVDVQINRLRKKIEEVPGRPRNIKTIRNAGYVLQPDAIG